MGTPPKKRTSTRGAASARTKGSAAAPRMPPVESAEGPAYGADLREAIARRAYEIYEAEGRPEGRDEAHWRRAEAELLGQLAAPRRRV